jgi:hypothetical protein
LLESEVSWDCKVKIGSDCERHSAAIDDRVIWLRVEEPVVELKVEVDLDDSRFDTPMNVQETRRELDS